MSDDPGKSLTREPPTLISRLMTSLEQAHTKRLRCFVKEGDVRVNLFFSGHDRASGVTILLAIVNALESELRNPHAEPLEKTIQDHEIVKVTDYNDIEEILK